MRQIGKKDSSYAECPTFEADPMLQVSLVTRLQGALNEANPMPQISKKDSSYAERSTLEADPYASSQGRRELVCKAWQLRSPTLCLRFLESPPALRTRSVQASLDPDSELQIAKDAKDGSYDRREIFKPDPMLAVTRD